MEYHRLDRGDLTALATGLGGAAVVRALRAGQLSRHLLLLKFLSERWPADRRDLDAAVHVLAEAQRRSPRRYAELLSDPLVGAWLTRTTRHLCHPERAAAKLPADLGHLGALAASAAVLLGLDADLAGHARQGRVTLPALGEAMLPGGADAPVRLSVSGGRVTVLGSTGTTTVPAGEPSWLELRRLTARHGELACVVHVEDGNPYRDGYHAPPSERLSASEAAHWQELFAGAWDLAGRHLSDRAAEFAAGLRAVVPLVDDGGGAARSGTARDSIGALGLTRPRSSEDFVITVVHEFQHSKLSAVLALVELYRPDGAEQHFAPWRTDARPTAGLIQGVYAFLGVADAWSRLRAEPGLERLATHRLAVVREQVRVGLVALEGSTELTAEGRHFTAGMRAATDRLLAEPLPEQARREGAEALADRRRAWQRRHPGLTVAK
jgi:HEXXH motif-containing protein